MNQSHQIQNEAALPVRGASNVRRDIAERLSWLPNSLVDWQTGYPLLDGRSERNQLGPVTYLALDVGIGVVASGLAAGTTMMAPALEPVTIILLLVVTGRLRKMQTLLGHEASHRNFFPTGDTRRGDDKVVFLGMTLNDLMGEIASSFALSTSVEDYRRDHDIHHDFTTYTTEKDPDTKYVLAQANLLWSFLNPLAYARDFWVRLKSNLFAKSPGKRLMSGIWLTTLLSLSLVMPFSAWLVAIFIPWVVLFRISAMVQILSLHSWALPPATDYQEYADRTWGRFNAVPLPPLGLEGIAWLKEWIFWWAEMLFLELPFRVGVLSPDLQAHDVHHLEWIMVHDLKVLPEFVDDWRNQPYRRAEVIRDSGDPLKMASREIWGVRAMWKIALKNLKHIKRVKREYGRS